MNRQKIEFIRPEFFYKLIYGNFFSDLGSGGRKKKKKKKKKSSENDQLTGHFQSFFFVVFRAFFLSFSELFFNIQKKTVKLVRQTSSLY